VKARRALALALAVSACSAPASPPSAPRPRSDLFFLGCWIVEPGPDDESLCPHRREVTLGEGDGAGVIRGNPFRPAPSRCVPYGVPPPGSVICFREDRWFSLRPHDAWDGFLVHWKRETDYREAEWFGDTDFGDDPRLLVGRKGSRLLVGIEATDPWSFELTRLPEAAAQKAEAQIAHLPRIEDVCAEAKRCAGAASPPTHDRAGAVRHQSLLGCALDVQNIVYSFGRFFDDLGEKRAVPGECL
jgi:hypothetical protein